jgi:hypothetical protein
MAQTKAIVDKLLTNVSNAYVPEGFIADKVLLPLGVKQTTGKIGSYGKDHLRITNTVMGGRGKARQIETIVRASTTYEVEAHGLEGMVTQDDYRNVEEPFDAESDETLGLKTVLALEKEKALADALGSTSIITQNTTLSGTAQYNDYTNSDPLDDFKTAQLAVYDGCGMMPDAAVMDIKTMVTLSYHPGILEALGFTANRSGILSRDEIARALNVKYLFVGDAAYNSAKEGQTDVLAPVWGKNIVFYKRSDRAVKYQTTLGYNIFYRNEGEEKVYKYDLNNPPESKGILVKKSYDQFIADAACAYLIKNAIA